MNKVDASCGSNFWTASAATSCKAFNISIRNLITNKYDAYIKRYLIMSSGGYRIQPKFDTKCIRANLFFFFCLAYNFWAKTKTKKTKKKREKEVDYPNVIELSLL